MSLEKYKQVIHKDFIKDIDFIDETIKKLNLNKNSTILDIGTGIGAMSILLAINGFDVLTGEPERDPERDDWNHHEHHHGEYHDGYSEVDWGNWRESAKLLSVKDKIKYQHFNAEDLPFSAKLFEGIFMYDSLQHIQNRERALNECLRVLTPDGLLCVIEWSIKAIRDEKEEYGYEIDYIDPKSYLNRNDISIKVNNGEFNNFYILRKKE